jgi:ribA/ribD-fused uncharacterized protein
MEKHTAVFEERVSLTSRDLRAEISNIETVLLDKLSSRLENKCSRHGFVIPGTIKILARSMGYAEKGRFTGDIVYHLQAEGSVYNPPSGVEIVGNVIRKNKMGMYASYEDAIQVILPRDLHIGNVEFENIQVGEKVRIQIQKSRFQVNDPYILSVGVFLGTTGESIPGNVEEAVPSTVIEDDVAEVEVAEGEGEGEAPLVIENEEEVVVEEEEKPLAPLEGGAANGTIRFYSKNPEYRELSNFYASPFTLDNKTWPSVEHYFQAMKFSSEPSYQEEIRKANTPAKAKSLGLSKEHPIRPDWDTEREGVMATALEAKFTQNESLKSLLLKTGTRTLEEASPSDSYWGVGRGKGKNRLGVLLMNLRSKLSSP